MTNKNNESWKILFEKYSIIEEIKKNGYFEITSAQIREFREARLMTKFDSYELIPKIFRDNKYVILPNSRGTYIISDFQAYYTFDKNTVKVENIEFPKNIQSIDFNNITSESAAINCAFVSGMFNDFIGESFLFPTVNGRMSSSNFNFEISRRDDKMFNFNVNRSQIEIDAGFESENFLTIVEAKNVLHDDFLIRQLYYPYRLWRNKISKEIKNIFFTYTNGIFHFREYQFLESNRYNSISLIKEKKYKIGDNIINTEIIEEITNNIKIIQEPNSPFPQADSFSKIINICEILLSRDTNAFNISVYLDFTSRQANYYLSAGIYLGLIIKSSNSYKISDECCKLFNLSITDRNIGFIKLILQHEIFNRIMQLTLLKGKISLLEISKEIKELKLLSSESTIKRRSITVKKWIEWIFEQITE